MTNGIEILAENLGFSTTESYEYKKPQFSGK